MQGAGVRGARPLLLRADRCPVGRRRAKGEREAPLTLTLSGAEGEREAPLTLTLCGAEGEREAPAASLEHTNDMPAAGLQSEKLLACEALVPHVLDPDKKSSEQVASSSAHPPASH